MTKLALFIFLGAAAPSVHAGDTKDARRDVFDVCILRDNLDENGASIWMRRGGRADRQLTMVVVLARLRLTRSVNQLRRSPFS
jgi:hypothetical protein